MVQRAKEMRFAGGAAVFPGGKVDPEDRVLAQVLAPHADQNLAAARIAGIRETLEETGLAIALDRQVSVAEAVEARALLLEQGAVAPVLEQFGWRLVLDKLVPFARWCPNWERAFDTRFFLTDLGTGAVDVLVDATENTRLFWCSAAEALRRADTNEIQVIFPTRRNLERLAQFASFSEARDHAEAIPVQTISPRQIEREGEVWLTIPEGLGYPVTGQPMSSVKRG
jgi:8-oxo-dGTP pyrophosphatase MutT (NUDIX family)